MAPGIWEKSSIPCQKCHSALSAFEEKVCALPGWQKWLLELSQISHYSDAYLQPIVVSARKETIDQNGQQLSKLSAEILLVLLNTNNSEIIWKSLANQSEVL